MAGVADTGFVEQGGWGSSTSWYRTRGRMGIVSLDTRCGVFEVLSRPLRLQQLLPFGGYISFPRWCLQYSQHLHYFHGSCIHSHLQSTLHLILRGSMTLRELKKRLLDYGQVMMSLTLNFQEASAGMLGWNIAMMTREC